MKSRVFIAADGAVDQAGVRLPVPWWSFTKTVLAVALLRLAELGQIDLDRVVEGKGYSPAQLLRHEAGLPDYGGLARYHADVAAGHAPWPVDELLKAVEAGRLRTAPGESWAYSNVGYLEVARLIEQTADRPLAEALAELVLTAAELTSARLAVTPEDLAGVEMGDAEGYHPGWVYHGLIVGTAIDAARLLRRLLAGELLSALSLARMLAPRALLQFRSAAHPDAAYGLGLMLSATQPGEQPIGHSGSGPGSGIAVYGWQGRTCAIWAATSAGIDTEDEVFQGLQDGGV